MKKTIISLTLGLCSCFAPAQETAIAEKTEAPSPLVVGNSLSYKISLFIPKETVMPVLEGFESTKNEEGTTYTYNETLIIEAPKKVEKLEKTLYPVKVLQNGTHLKNHFYQYEADTTMYYGTQTLSQKEGDKPRTVLLGTPIVIHANTLKLSEYWEWQAPKIANFKFVLLSKNQEIEVNGKKFITDKIRMDQLDQITKEVQLTKEYWYAKGIGIVKEVEKKHMRAGQAIIKRMELVEFKSGK